MMPDHACHSYERWRRQWLAGDNSHAIETVQFHGLLGALAVSSNSALGKRPSSAAHTAPSELWREHSEVVMAEAASHIRRLLKALHQSSIHDLSRLPATVRPHHV